METPQPSNIIRLETRLETVWAACVRAKKRLEADPSEANARLFDEAWRNWLDQFLKPEQRDVSRFLRT